MAKGDTGEGTGAAARKAIQDAQDAGCTLEEIATASNRSASVISAIKSGEIKNPPEELVARLRSCAAKAKARNS